MKTFIALVELREEAQRDLVSFLRKQFRNPVLAINWARERSQKSDSNGQARVVEISTEKDLIIWSSENENVG